MVMRNGLWQHKETIARTRMIWRKTQGLHHKIKSRIWVSFWSFCFWVFLGGKWVNVFPGRWGLLQRRGVLGWWQWPRRRGPDFILLGDVWWCCSVGINMASIDLPPSLSPSPSPLLCFSFLEVNVIGEGWTGHMTRSFSGTKKKRLWGKLFHVFCSCSCPVFNYSFLAVKKWHLRLNKHLNSFLQQRIF